MKPSRLREAIVTSLAGVFMLLVTVGLLYVLVALDDSPHQCATKTAAKVYDERCF
jgi:hypothetical protein